MLHNRYPVTADNGQQVFLAEDVEQILSMYFDRDDNGRRRYSDNEVMDQWEISRAELDRMLYRLSYDYCHDENGNYKF